jgi:hypothetical protein
MMNQETFYFTVIDRVDGREHKVNFQYTPEGTTVFSGTPIINFDNQQLAELGHLFVALAGNDVDVDQDTINELLSGYGLDHLVCE